MSNSHLIRGFQEGGWGAGILQNSTKPLIQYGTLLGLDWQRLESGIQLKITTQTYWVKLEVTL
jgi:hypothetical protein